MDAAMRAATALTVALPVGVGGATTTVERGGETCVMSVAVGSVGVLVPVWMLVLVGCVGTGTGDGVMGAGLGRVCCPIVEPENVDAPKVDMPC